MANQKFWIGKAPQKDDITGEQIVDEFIDGTFRGGGGKWAIMSPKTFRNHGIGLGTGLGQRYRKMDDGRWLKVEG